MTTLQIYSDIHRSLSIISQEESLMRKAAKYLRNLAKEASTPGDDTLMTKAEFEAKIKSSLEQAKNGEVVTLLPGENIEDLLARCGYEI